jgi:hypothetical protein
MFGLLLIGSLIINHGLNLTQYINISTLDGVRRDAHTLTMFHVDDNVKRLDLVVLSDRGGLNDTQPLKALVNSILLYTTHPVNLNVVTKNRLPWLDALNEAPHNVFRVHYHSPSIIFAQ